ncbi:MAG: hypothetical protein U0457_11600 [Candidatus Sericytochromatia bacterium]
MAIDENFIKIYKNEFISEFNNFNDDVKRKFINNPKTKKIAYMALNRNINLLSEEGLNIFIRKLKSQNIPSYLFGSFISNYSSFSEEVRDEILQILLKGESTKRHVARIIFEKFDLFSKEDLNIIIKELVNSEDKKVNYYLSKILKDFYERISIDSRDKILNKIIKCTKNTDIYFSLIEEKIFKNPDEIINSLSKTKLSRNFLKKLSKKLFQEISSLPEKSLNYLFLLSKEYRNSRYVVWYFIQFFKNIDEELRTELLNNFIISQDPFTIEAFLLSLIDSEIQIDYKEEILFRISENPVCLIPFAKVLNKNFDKLNETIRIKLLRKIFISSETCLLLIELVIENTNISVSLKKEFLNNFSAILDSFPINYSIKNKIETIAKKIKTKFRSIPDEIKNDLVKILFENYYSRKVATLIIIENSNKLSDEINSLILLPVKENNLMIQEIKKIPQKIKQKILKDILLNEQNILTIQDLERDITNEFKTSYGVSTPQEEGLGGSAPVPPETPEQSSEVFSNKNKWEKKYIIDIEKRYKEPFEKIPLEVLFKIIVQDFSLDSINIKDFKATLNCSLSTNGIEWVFSFDNSPKFSYNIELLNTTFLGAIFSIKHQIEAINGLQTENKFNDSLIYLHYKIFLNQKSINIIASKLRLDFYKFNEVIRNELLILLMNYSYTDYLYHFIVKAIKYNIDKISESIKLQVIKKLNGNKYWKGNIENELKKLL